ncbi:MaoC/PaaZ C-terminal domain-containing protein [Pseudomonas sp. BF-R-19]|uniref:MaoC/PaaZ C-terminal domain-containing protein n=1 Tax=Pseudomonas sp. BF-R-19 TaxID=2832397 RepID=UPI001CBAFB4C|nr:MaoC/PaaZ C-terminal domain-containing protein [Pseudomonas sp. BF-R-19]
MAIDYQKLMALKIPDGHQTYTYKDTILYALSIGYGTDPLNTEELPFVYEKDIRAVPSMAGVLAHPGFWARDLDTGIDWVRMVHSEMGLILHKPLPPNASLISKSRILEVVDKGEGRGAIVQHERMFLDRNSGELLCTSVQSIFCRGDGGFGGPPRSLQPPHPMPERPADWIHEQATTPGMALLYRLNGDWNPLHADPKIANKAGFERPILHGLATYGVACKALLDTVCENDPSRLASIFCRFTAPVYPGETLRTEIWLDGNVVSYRVKALDRDLIVLNNGKAELREPIYT